MIRGPMARPSLPCRTKSAHKTASSAAQDALGSLAGDPIEGAGRSMAKSPIVRLASLSVPIIVFPSPAQTRCSVRESTTCLCDPYHIARAEVWLFCAFPAGAARLRRSVGLRRTPLQVARRSPWCRRSPPVPGLRLSCADTVPAPPGRVTGGVPPLRAARRDGGRRRQRDVPRSSRDALNVRPTLVATLAALSTPVGPRRNSGPATGHLVRASEDWGHGGPPSRTHDSALVIPPPGLARLALAAAAGERRLRLAPHLGAGAALAHQEGQLPAHLVFGQRPVAVDSS